MNFYPSSLARLRPLALLVLLAGAPACHRLMPGSSPPSSSSSSAMPRPSESGMATLLLLANRAEAGYAEVALARVTRPDVKELAQRLATDHAALGIQLGEIVARLDITPTDEPAGLSFRERSNARRARLRAATERGIDSTYVQLEIDTHHELLDLVDQQLLPAARHAELKEYLAALGPALRAHLAHAEQVRATLAAR